MLTQFHESVHDDFPHKQQYIKKDILGKKPMQRANQKEEWIKMGVSCEKLNQTGDDKINLLDSQWG